MQRALLIRFLTVAFASQAQLVSFLHADELKFCKKNKTTLYINI